MQGEGSLFLTFVVKVYGKFDALVKRIGRFFLYSHGYAVCHVGMNRTRTVYQGGHTMVGRGIP